MVSTAAATLRPDGVERVSAFRPFPIEEYQARWARVHERMTQLGYEIAVIWGKTSGVYERAGDTLYLTNFFSTHSGQEPDTVLWNGRSFSAVIMQRGQVPDDVARPDGDVVVVR